MLPRPGFSFAITMAGTMGGMLLANQFAFDGSAYAAHLLSRVPGRDRAAGPGRGDRGGGGARPGRVVVAVVAILTDQRDPAAGRIRPAGGELRRRHRGRGAALGAGAYALPENSNPFAINSGGGSAKGLLALVAMIGTLVIAMPIAIAGVPGRRGRAVDVGAPRSPASGTARARLARHVHRGRRAGPARPRDPGRGDPEALSVTCRLRAILSSARIAWPLPA